MSSSSNAAKLRVLAPPLAAAVLLGACSDLYFDRRETVLFGAQDAVANNVAVHTIDPWPAAAGDRRIPGQGTTVAIATERYRTGRVIKPQGLGTTSTWSNSRAADGAGTVAAETGGGAANP